MARNVRFIRTTKEKWLNRDSYDPLALYFCEDTQEMCKGDQILTDGIRVVPTKADLPTLPFAADGVIYYVANTKSGYMMSPDRTEWLQTIYAPVEDVTKIPEDEVYKTVTTVGAVRDIENAIYTYIDQEIANVEISGSVGKDGLSAYEIWLNNGHTGTESDFLNWLKGQDGSDGQNGVDGQTPYIQDGYWYIGETNTGVKAEGIDGKDGADGTNGQDGANGADGRGVAKTEINAGGELVITYTDNTSINLGKVIGSNGQDGSDGEDGQDGANGEDGKTPYIQDSYWYIDGVNTGVKAEGVDGKDGQNGADGTNGKDGINGADGKTPYIKDDYWYIDGVNTNVKAKGSDGIDGVNGQDGTNGKDGINGKSAYDLYCEVHPEYTSTLTEWLQSLKGADGKDGVDGKDGLNGADGKDGLNGKDGASGKDGKSAYEIWIDAGHSGSEDEFLQWLKGDNDPFGDVVTSIECNGIAAGTSLKGKTVKDVLVMLLGIQNAQQSAVQVIMTNRIPAYSGTTNTGDAEVVYAELDTATADYRDEGFYVTKDDNGNITNAGYQVAFEGNSEMDAQTFAVPSNAKIVGAYQYDEFGTQTWLQYEFPGSYWVAGDVINETINGQNITYQTYSYDVDGVGDAITTSEYWRFEIEV